MNSSSASGVSDTSHFAFDISEFFLVIQTKFMNRMFTRSENFLSNELCSDFCNSFGQRVLVIDSTHNTNQYGCKLITISVVDPQNNKGYPTVFCVCSKENSTLLALWKIINVGKLDHSSKYF